MSTPPSIGGAGVHGPTEPGSVARDWGRRISQFEARGTLTRPPADISFGGLDPSELGEWDAFVERHPLGSIYHGSQWMRVIERAFPHMKGQVLVAREPAHGGIVGGIPLYRVRSWVLGNRVVCVPFAAWCDPLAGEACPLPVLLDEVFRALGTDDVASFEFRPWQTAPEMATLGFDVRDLYLHHFLPLDKPLEALRKACSRTCVRQWVNKAERQGVKTHPVSSRTEFDAFYGLVSEIRRTHSLPLIPQRFFAEMREHLATTHTEWWLASREDRPIGAVAILKAHGTFTLEHAGQSEEGRAVGANQLLYWQALERAREQGYARLSFGRTSAQNHPLCEYKRHWGTTEVELPEYVVPRLDRLRSGYRKRRVLYRTARAVLGHVPGPLQRWVGELCYRHWG